jgi:CBS domain-containing protein
MTLVREAMLADPVALDATATAQEAARHLVRPDVRAILVVADDGRLLGVVTEATLVEGVVAAGRDPASVSVGELAIDAVATVEADVPIEEAVRILEAEDVERLPVTEQGRLVGVLSRSGLHRRLAEDAPPRGDEPEMP